MIEFVGFDRRDLGSEIIDGKAVSSGSIFMCEEQRVAQMKNSEVKVLDREDIFYGCSGRKVNMSTEHN